MNELIEALDTILLCLQYFCLGGMLFTDKRKTYWMLATLSIVFGITAIVL